ncbi:polysaccharide deacetylase family protein [Halomarina oriensis]|uniref:Polysaccharide deacetylase family protein n=1 Tax=Halomarina oriensis TaxID=671145 RepID=A0A6B0GN58_9EURY|nr:polysaccharide deacetylase family protein [Halomarina oriensis]MWG36302.1 polysaccharide deacetylase family protein [Halomarina oriensis]
MRVPMYHYVRPTVDRPPGGYYRLALADFRAQLDRLASRYDLLDREQALAVLRGERPPPDDGVLLTFDDGLVDHHEWVLPELRDRGVCGVFFVTTGPLDGCVPAVHRVHALLGAVPAREVHAALRETMADRDVSPDRGRSADTYDEGGVTGDDAEAAAAVKRLVNFELPPTSVSKLVGAVEERLSKPTPSVDSYYLSATQLRDLDEAGMLLGAHTVTHPVLSRLPPAAQRVEVRDSFDRLESLVGPLDVRLFAYPYGGAETFTDETTAILQESGCDLAFTTVSGTVDAESLTTSPYELRRQDCNEFPHGGATFDL